MRTRRESAWNPVTGSLSRSQSGKDRTADNEAGRIAVREPRAGIANPAIKKRDKTPCTLRTRRESAWNPMTGSLSRSQSGKVRTADKDAARIAIREPRYQTRQTTNGIKPHAT